MNSKDIQQYHKTLIKNLPRTQHILTVIGKYKKLEKNIAENKRRSWKRG